MVRCMNYVQMRCLWKIYIKLDMIEKSQKFALKLFNGVIVPVDNHAPLYPDLFCFVFSLSQVINECSLNFNKQGCKAVYK